MDGLLSVTALTVGYRIPVVREVTFSLQQGELTGLLGRNGSGKTTLLRGLTGGARVFGGSVSCEGRDLLLCSDRKRARHLALLSQRRELPEGLRVREVIAMGRYAHRGIFGGGEHERALVDGAARRFGIADLLDADCAALSEGQRQLVQLARVAVQEAPVLLLDEPNSSLDIENTHRLFSEVRRLADEEGCGVLSVLHDPALALRWCDRLLLLLDGRLSEAVSVSKTPPEELERFLQRLYPALKLKRDRETGILLCILQESSETALL